MAEITHGSAGSRRTKFLFRKLGQMAEKWISWTPEGRARLRPAPPERLEPAEWMEHRVLLVFTSVALVAGARERRVLDF